MKVTIECEGDNRDSMLPALEAAVRAFKWGSQSYAGGGGRSPHITLKIDGFAQQPRQPFTTLVPPREGESHYHWAQDATRRINELYSHLRDIDEVLSKRAGQ